MNRLKKLLFSKQRMKFLAFIIALYIFVYIVLRYFGIDRETLSPLIETFGQHSILTIFLLQLIFSLTPLPDSIVMYFAVVAIGLYDTFIAVYLGMLVASIIHFTLAKKYGPKVVYKLFPKFRSQIEAFKGKLDTHHLLLYRFFNLVSFDIIAYVAAFSGVSFKKFILSTVIALVPLIIPNILLAHGLVENNFIWTLILWVIAGLIMLLLAYIVKKIY
ncbi:VTT domain-containing protein [Candidatus Dojkabacteria bacterium]|nr:VTT domain-containing protein [Candidatus Dojkabacteria bacterium]